MPKTTSDSREADADALNEYLGQNPDEADVDFSQVPESSFGVALPPGDYNAVVLDVEKKQGQKGPYYNWRFAITDDPYQDVNVWLITSIAPKAADGTHKTLQIILGEPIPRGEFRLAEYKDRFMGRPVRLKTTTEEYPEGSGVSKTKVSRVLPAKPSTGENGQAANTLF